MKVPEYRASHSPWQRTEQMLITLAVPSMVKALAHLLGVGERGLQQDAMVLFLHFE